MSLYRARTIHDHILTFIPSVAVPMAGPRDERPRDGGGAAVRDLDRTCQQGSGHQLAYGAETHRGQALQSAHFCAQVTVQVKEAGIHQTNTV